MKIPLVGWKIPLVGWFSKPRFFLLSLLTVTPPVGDDSRVDGQRGVSIVSICLPDFLEMEKNKQQISSTTVDGWNLAPPDVWNPKNNGINYL